MGSDEVRGQDPMSICDACSVELPVDETNEADGRTLCNECYSDIYEEIPDEV